MNLSISASNSVNLAWMESIPISLNVKFGLLDFVCNNFCNFSSFACILATIELESHDDVAVAVPTLKPYKPRNILEKIQVVEYTLSSFTRKILSFKNSSSAAPACSFFRKNIFEK